jgi:hypothetical protein
MSVLPLKPGERAMFSRFAFAAIQSGETARHDWIDVPDTQVRRIALRGVLTAICLIAACFTVFYSLAAPADVHDIVLVPSL